ncbi:hypothetical protein L1987_04554 [Smallanthus sonchifolius]|uniref:Uncharacterized protein n=1 Tax=Smallanthus sonchifolius TaxID=185202 RepID=A0ACB9JSX1_9ASTR|nr:hypothetical protein L1987_04554 [Smallanthus sonchifolius]
MFQVSMAEFVNDDVLEKILIGLDVKDLIRCKSVCKSWYSFITSPHFIYRHLNYSYNNELGHRRITSVTHSGFNCRFCHDHHHLVGSSNGLVCISSLRSELLVGNPFTREKIKLGSEGLEVSAIGLGCMGMSGGYGPAKPEDEMIKVIHHAINSGVTHLDTSDVYGPHTNEILVGKALKGVKREDVQLATKFGIKLGESMGIHGEPEYVRACCEASLKRLDVDYIDIYYIHRIDTKTPIEITMGELKKLVEEGKIKYIGLSEAGPATIRRAHAVHPITAVQLEWSLWTRDAEEEVIPTCRELGIGIVPFAPLGSGFFASGPKVMDNLADNDLRKIIPRLQGENFDHNKLVYERVSEMAQRKGCTPSQLALAWVLHQGDNVGPIPGTTKIENLNQNLGALGVMLTAQDMAELESMASFKGARMPEQILVHSYKNSDTPLLSSWKSE